MSKLKNIFAKLVYVLKNNIFSKHLLCSNCFNNHGLRVNAFIFGVSSKKPCSNCNTSHGKKLCRNKIIKLADMFFVQGTQVKLDYGGAPSIQFNQSRYGSSDNDFPEAFKKDMSIISEKAKIGFFHYGPHLWAVGINQFLEKLQDSTERTKAILNLISKSSSIRLESGYSFVRLRIKPDNPFDNQEYDSPPAGKGSGRFDSLYLPILYGSENYNICIHECKTHIDDLSYIAVLKLNRSVTLINLNYIEEEGWVHLVESIQTGLTLLLNAGEHSYEISREVARAIKDAGFDGIVYPSYYSAAQLGRERFETVLGMPASKFYKPGIYEKAKNIENLALFGHPVKEGTVTVESINRLWLKAVDYDFFLGPIEHENAKGGY